MNIAFPFHVGPDGRTATAGVEEHLRGLVEQLLFTAPGERVHRPELGTGLREMVFAPGGDELASAARLLVQGALQQWLGELIQVEAVEVEAEEATLTVTVRYLVRRSQERREARFTGGVGS
ncbi:MAG: GPW/gp25 family protein [Acidobacteriota bacterium]